MANFSKFSMHHFLQNRELDELYISVAIRSFSLSMITLFIPFYLLKLAYPLKLVFLFYASANLLHALFVPAAAKISAHIGFKHTILIRELCKSAKFSSFNSGKIATYLY